MRKIPTLFVRDPDERAHVLPEIAPGCEWVAAGEGVPTRKYDGTCVLYDGERWWARREVKADKTPPAGFAPVEMDDTTGKTVGWEPAEQSPFIKYLREAVAGLDEQEPGTYELIGPKINGNPEGEPQHRLVAHVLADEVDAPRDYDGLRDWLAVRPFEGVVWHHPDGRMAKIKRRDFAAGRLLAGEDKP